MKKVLCLILVSILLIVEINDVDAKYKKGDYFGTVAQDQLTYSYGGFYHYWYTAGGQNVFCLQPGFGGHPVGASLTVKKVLGSSPNEKYYMAGMEKIVNASHNTEKDKIAVLTAVRVYTWIWRNAGLAPVIAKPSGDLAHVRATAYVYNRYLYGGNSKKSSYSNAVTSNRKLVRKAIGKKANWPGLATPYGSGIVSNATDSNQIAKKVFAILDDAFKAAADARENGVSSGGSVKIANRSEYNVRKENNTRVHFKKVTFEKVKDKKGYVSIDLACKNCNVSYKIKARANNEKGYNTTLSCKNGKCDVSKYINNKGNGTVFLRIELTNNDPTNCLVTEYTITASANVASSKYSYYYLYAPGKESVIQDFLGIVKENNSDTTPVTDSKKQKLDFCNLDCNDLEVECNSGNQDACDKFQKEYGGDCAECTTHVDNLECQPGEGNISLKEGQEIDPETCTVGAQKNVKQCVINKSDIAGNSYQATTDGYPNNDYCRVYCNEDYDITVPGALTTNSGRYLKLGAKISGTKSCYTSEINTDKFNADLEAARKAIIDAWNEWSHWYNGLHNYTTVTDEGCSATGCGSCSGHIYQRTWNYPTYNYNGVAGSASDSDSGGGCSNGGEGCCAYGKDKDGNTVCTGGYSCGCGYRPSCSTYTSSMSNSRISGKLASAKSALESAIKAYNKILREYNSCSTTVTQTKLSSQSNGNSTFWNMAYNYNPTISFWYEDAYYEIAPKKNLVTNGAPAMSGVAKQVCNGTVDETYGTCSTGWINSNGTTSAKGMFVCYASGSVYKCSTVSMNISDAKYVKESQTVSANYEAPTQFYTVYPSGKLITEPQEGTSPLENALPISLSAGAGVYNYTLSVTNLGEFYDSDKLGRIWGAEESTVVVTLAEDNECKEGGALVPTDDGKYVCAYKVNCPGCDIVCEEDECTWKDCDDGGCTVICENCLYTNRSANFGYRTVSTRDINPNKRELGTNWKYDENAITTATQMKAYATSTKIVDDGEKIYGDSDEKVLTVKLTQSMINEIKDYNDEFDSKGGYASDSLKCYDFTDEDGKKYENVYCYSTFLDRLQSKYKDNMTFVKDRVTMSGEYNAKDLHDKRSKIRNQCESGNSDKCYWTTWTDALNNSRFTINTSIGITNFKNNYDSLGVGPSWK